MQMIAQTTAADAEHQELVAESQRDRLIGIALIAGLPAFFWTIVLAFTAPSFGYTPTPGALFATAAGIGSFLAFFGASVTARSP